MSNILHSFSDLMNQFFININGSLVERSKDKFIWNRKSYDSLSDVRKAIDDATKAIEESIKR